MMLLEGVRTRKEASLRDIPQPLRVGSALWPWSPFCPQSTGVGAPVSPEPVEPAAPSPSTIQRKTGRCWPRLDWMPAPCPGPTVGVEHRLGGSSLGCCLLSFAPLARRGEEKGIIKPKRLGNFFLEREDAGQEALVPGMAGQAICQPICLLHPHPDPSSVVSDLKDPQPSRCSQDHVLTP